MFFFARRVQRRKRHFTNWARNVVDKLDDHGRAPICSVAGADRFKNLGALVQHINQQFLLPFSIITRQIIDDCNVPFRDGVLVETFLPQSVG